MVTAAGLPLISAVKWNKPELSTTPESSSQNVLLQSNCNGNGSSSASSAIVSKEKGSGSNIYMVELLTHSKLKERGILPFQTE
jgi:hypothetical protein